MAQFTVTLPDDAQVLLVAAFAAKYGYSAFLADGSKNPQAPDAFAKDKLVEYARSVVREYVIQQAQAKAAAAAAGQVDALPVTIT